MQERIVKETLRSELMRRDVPFRVLLPESYGLSGRRYAVLYLLHGLFGSCDNWLELTRITDHSREMELIIVMAEGGDGWYTDSATAEDERHESYVVRELMPEIERRFRCDAERRGVAGLSMGGYGALKFALKYPGTFVFAGSMSSAFVAPRLSREDCPSVFEELLPSAERAFGERDSQVRIENDLFCIIKNMPPEGRVQTPYIYLDCGIEDSFLETNRELAELLRNLGIRHEYHEEPGGHDWDYWDRQLKKLLSVAAGILI